MTDDEHQTKLAEMTDVELNQQLEANWSALLEYEEKCFLRCVELDRETPDKTDDKAAAVREWWGVTNAILRMFVNTRAQFNHELKPFPAYTLRGLANVAEELSSGNLPSFVADAAKGGRPLWRQERHHTRFHTQPQPRPQ